MGEPINPVIRMYNIVALAKEAKGGTVREAWIKILQLKPGITTPELFVAIAEVSHLNRRCMDLISGLQLRNQALYLAPFLEVNKVLSISNLEAVWGEARKMLEQNVELGLQYAMEKVAEQPTMEELISRGDLEDLKADVDVLRDDVQQAAIPEDLKSAFLKHLDEIIKAINKYNIGGVDGLVDAMESNVGFAVVNRHALKEVFDKSKEIGGKFAGVLLRMSQLAGAARGLKQLGTETAEFIANHLPHVH